jgi:GR25 family glycosyltransferase involved in LPS biosynthesis
MILEDDVQLQSRTQEALPRFRGSRRNRHSGKGAREDRWWLRATQSGGTLRKPFVYRGARSRLERELDELQGPELEEVA